MNAYLLLATACDGTLATTAQFTSIRVVCNNTLAIALGDSTSAVKVPHRSQFDAQAVKRQLGIAISSWDGFMVRMKALAERKVNDSAAETFFQRVLTYPTSTGLPAPTTNDSAIKAAHALYAGRGKGATLPSASGTAWGRSRVGVAVRGRWRKISVDGSWNLHKNSVDVFLNLHIYKARTDEFAASGSFSPRPPGRPS